MYPRGAVIKFAAAVYFLFYPAKRHECSWSEFFVPAFYTLNETTADVLPQTNKSATGSSLSGFNWVDQSPAIISRIHTGAPAVALTFDLCPRLSTNAFDNELFEFLLTERIPATIFISGGWLIRNSNAAERIKNSDGFEIANHGLQHRPASLHGRSRYRIKGTLDAHSLFHEIVSNEVLLEGFYHVRPKWYRSATACYEHDALSFIRAQGFLIAGYTLAGDSAAGRGVRFTHEILYNIKPGDIVLIHLNRPGTGTAAAVIPHVRRLKKNGFVFVRLSDCVYREGQLYY